MVHIGLYQPKVLDLITESEGLKLKIVEDIVLHPLLKPISHIVNDRILPNNHLSWKDWKLIQLAKV